jgi:hypothetical protein
MRTVVLQAALYAAAKQAAGGTSAAPCSRWIGQARSYKARLAKTPARAVQGGGSWLPGAAASTADPFLDGFGLLWPRAKNLPVRARQSAMQVFVPVFCS